MSNQSTAPENMTLFHLHLTSQMGADYNTISKVLGPHWEQKTLLDKEKSIN